MAVAHDSPAARVVGFSGTPVPGGAGIKPAVLEHPAGSFYTDTGKPPDIVYDAAEVEEFAERGLLCRTGRTWRPMRDGVFLYAHEDFVRPEPASLVEAIASFDHDERLRVFLAYLPFDSATRTLKHWGKILVDDAEDHARRGKFRRALEAAERAYYTVLPEPPDNRRDHELNRRLFVCLGAAYIGLDEQDLQNVLDDARIDFSEREVIQIRDAAHGLVQRSRVWSRDGRFRDYGQRRLVKRFMRASSPGIR